MRDISKIDLKEENTVFEKLEETQKLINKIAERYESVIRSYTGYELSENGLNELKKWVKKYTIEEINEAIEISIEKYFTNIYDEESKSVAFNKFFNMIPRIIKCKQQTEEKPILKQVYYLRKILINRLSGVDKPEATSLITKLLELCPDQYEDIKILCCGVKSWSEFVEIYHELIKNFDFA